VPRKQLRNIIGLLIGLYWKFRLNPQSSGYHF